ncbi:MAG: endo alpha-1,4 polygalactosaminidase [Candidatus Undinarchaeales archaeon]|jgi:cysteinyl-tRNA synthetase|nr:endo alpha-1,4 polygalactosaminidase [Candidatus Undinarchaeales archaeon]
MRETGVTLVDAKRLCFIVAIIITILILPGCLGPDKTVEAARGTPTTDDIATSPRVMTSLPATPTGVPTPSAPPTVATSTPSPAPRPDDEGPTTADITTFHYQLQGATLTSLKALDVDVLVIDVDDANLSDTEVSELKEDGTVVLSYLSIGEAEEYRGYWKEGWRVGDPSFIDAENPEWKGNFKVRYWDEGWQAIILERIRKISGKGYDGVYLDIIDAYWYYESRGRETAAGEMVELVQRIKSEGTALDLGFVVVAQNAPELYEHAEYREAIDGFGKEDTWYNDDDVQDAEETTFVLPHLERAIVDGKFVLSIDYPTEPQKVCDFYTRCREHRFACTVSGRGLDQPRPVPCEG